MCRSKLFICIELKLNKIFGSANIAIEVWSMYQFLSIGFIFRLKNFKYSSIMLTTSINDKILRGEPSRTIKDSFADNLSHATHSCSKNRSIVEYIECT